MKTKKTVNNLCSLKQYSNPITMDSEVNYSLLSNVTSLRRLNIIMSLSTVDIEIYEHLYPRLQTNTTQIFNVLYAFAVSVAPLLEDLQIGLKGLPTVRFGLYNTLLPPKI